jgi:hypothetical protein
MSYALALSPRRPAATRRRPGARREIVSGVDYPARIAAAASLDDLAATLNAIEAELMGTGAMLEDVVDLETLPVFGSNPPANPGGWAIYSYDDEYVLINDGAQWMTEARSYMELSRRRARSRRADGLSTVTDPALVDAPISEVTPPLVMWDITDATGALLGTFEASSADDAILSWLASQGYESADAAAAALGYASGADLVASLMVTEALAPAPAELVPAEMTPAEMLSLRRRLARKAAWTVLVSGSPAGSFDGSTAEDAILSYVTSLGYMTVDEAAMGMGFASVDEFLATITVEEAMSSDMTGGADPADPSSLYMSSRRSRRRVTRARLARKGTWDVMDAETGEIIGSYDGSTAEDAILSYVTALGYETVDAAAAGEGFGTVDEFLATITITEAVPAEEAPPAEAADDMAEEDEEEMPEETAGRRSRF